ncbi:TIGR03619 family F420-dependent LLM class oxidoreductase [Dactylosporangium salmoneum]|uniref:LLM class F420-dependent oxidoreductase n=1 Tax=Dactylosporangium salmoneum TaxID=53361 RepID=A0ABP5U8L5_9ACTN
MKISLACWPSRLPGEAVAGFVAAAAAADRAGLFSIHLGEHVLIGSRTDRYPYGRFEFGRDVPWPDPLICLAAAAVVTSRIRLSTGALLAPLRPPAVLAKEIATLDVLSQGRTQPVFGVGWQREEYEACRVPWSQRYTLLEGNLVFCRNAWQQPVFSVAGLEDVTCVPRPSQPRVPVLLALAPTDRNVERIARLADGWCPMLTSPEELRAAVTRLREAFERHDRDPDDVIVRAPAPLYLTPAGRLDVKATYAAAEQLRAAGATVVAIGLPPGLRSPSEVTDTIDAIAAGA